MTQMQPTTLQPGMKVFAGSDEIGKVTAVWDRDIEVTRGLVFRHTYIIPRRYVTAAAAGVVDLSLDREAVERLEATPEAVDELPEEYRRLEGLDDWNRPDDPRDTPIRH